MKTNFLKIIYLIIFININNVLHSSPEVMATVDKTTVYTDEQIVLALTINNGSGNEEINPPKSEFFNIQNAGTSSQTTIINGQMSRSVVFNFIIIPNKPGQTRIEPFIVIKNGQKFETDPIAINILPPNTRKNSDSVQSDNEAMMDANELKVELKADKNEVYIDEPVVLRFKIYRRGDVRVNNVDYDIPKMTEFLTEPPAQAQNVGTINGIQYEVTEVKTILYPSSTGEFTIGPGVLKGEIIKRIQRQKNQRRRANSPFESFFDDEDDPFQSFFGSNLQAKPFRIASKTVSLKVIPLPESDKPKNFNGTVGNYKLNVEYSNLSKIKKGDSITITMSVEGAGHINAICEPLLTNTTGFKLFDSETSIQPLINNEKLAGKKIFKKMIVVEKFGKLKIPDVEFSFFNPYEKKYITLKKTGPEINVENIPDSKYFEKIYEADSSAKKTEKKDLALSHQDIIFINTSTNSLKKYSESISWKYFFMYILSAPIFLILIYIPVARKNLFQTNIALKRKTFAFKEFKKQYNSIKFDPKNHKSSCSNLTKAMSDYFANKLNLPTGIWTVFEIDKKFTELKMPEINKSEFIKILEKLDMYSFGMSEISQNDWKKIYKNILDTVESIERLNIWKN